MREKGNIYMIIWISILQNYEWEGYMYYEDDAGTYGKHIIYREDIVRYEKLWAR